MAPDPITIYWTLGNHPHKLTYYTNVLFQETHLKCRPQNGSHIAPVTVCYFACPRSAADKGNGLWTVGRYLAARWPSSRSLVRARLARSYGANLSSVGHRRAPSTTPRCMKVVRDRLRLSWPSNFWLVSTVECRYNAVTFVMILHSILRWQWQNVSQTNTGVSFVRILEKIDCVITAPYCMWQPHDEAMTWKRLSQFLHYSV